MIGSLCFLLHLSAECHRCQCKRLRMHQWALHGSRAAAPTVHNSAEIVFSILVRLSHPSATVTLRYLTFSHTTLG